MKVTNENIQDINFFAYINRPIQDCQTLLSALLDDILELNNLVKEHGELHKQIYIDYYDEHTDGYSPERTEPCPDYYGLFNLRFEKNPYETVGTIMDLDELDTVLCALINFEEAKLS